MKKTKDLLAPAQIQCLKKQRFSDDEPGTILKDLTSLLDFIETAGGIAVSEKNHLFAVKILPELNRLLSHPLDVKLKRPVQKSFAHINGLYLLLRVSGVAYIESAAKQSKMVLDNTMLAAWNALNPTERYFALLHAWRYRGNSEIIGERSGWRGGYGFFDSLAFFTQRLGDGIDTHASGYDHWAGFRYNPGLHNLALMELFGFIAIERDPALEGDTWPIARVMPTAWGHALLDCFSDQKSLYDLLAGQMAEEQSDFWESALKSHIPAWKNTLPQPETAVIEEGVYIFKVTLGKAYRKFAVPADTLLDDLAGDILSAFNFDNDHLYEFIYKNRYGVTERIAHPSCDDEYCTDEYAVGELPLKQGMEFTFHFDFGDDWMFQILVEEPVLKDRDYSETTVIERHGKAPKQYGRYD
jgi:hypothetical protein